MERLLNLLQEFYGENRKFSNDNGLLTMTNGVENLSGAYAQTYIISLKGGFIKWLVENDKIDQWRVTDKEKMSCWELVEMDIDDFPKKEKLIERLLMLLSISSSPIEDLISYLK